MNEPEHYRVLMLSSTFTDLKKHREQAIKAIRPANILQVRGAVAEVESA